MPETQRTSRSVLGGGGGGELPCLAPGHVLKAVSNTGSLAARSMLGGGGGGGRGETCDKSSSSVGFLRCKT